MLLAGVGAGLYYGWPVVRDRLVDPVEANTAEVGVLQDRLIEMAGSTIGSVQERL